MEKIFSTLTLIKDNEVKEITSTREEYYDLIFKLLKENYIIVSNQYSFVLYNNKYEYHDYMKQLKIYIPNKINDSSISITYDIIKNHEENSNIINKLIYNIRGDDYDLYQEDNLNDNDKTNSVSKIFLCYVRKKLNLLSESEKKMFQYYREFDLERLLTSDEITKFPLNNDNAGVISIFDNEIYTSTCTKVQHSGEIDYHIKKHDKEQKIESEDTIYTKKEKFHEIIIQVLKGELLIWTPEKITEFQKEQLFIILEKVKMINKKSNIIVWLDKIEKQKDTTNNIDNIISFVEQMDVKVNLK